MTREEEYKCTILIIYESGKNFINMSKRRGLGKEQLGLLIDEYTELFYNVIMLCALRDDFISKDDYNELLGYVERLLYCLKECLE